MARLTVIFSALCLFLVHVAGPPVSERPPAREKDVNNEKVEQTPEEVLGLEYERYMREVVSLLESDEEFRKKLESVNASEIRSGEIASHLDLVNHTIRNRLDELKRQEIDRLRNLIRIEGRLMQKEAADGSVNKAALIAELETLLGHVDFDNPHSFEISDLTKLIKKTTSDLEEIDAKRRKDFKRYEMEKEMARREEMKKMSMEEKEAAEKKHDEMEKKHKDHPKIHHPGNEEQLKEVWEETDGMEKKDFDPKVFFHMHDTNGDGMLDIGELESLFQNELDKLYDPNATEDDMVQRFEEMNRMREHVLTEIDTNGDMMVSFEEFMNSTKTDEFKTDESWQTLDNQTIYTEEELAIFEKEYAERLAHEEKAHETTPPVSIQTNEEDKDLKFQQHQQEKQHQQQLAVQSEGTVSKL